MQSANASTKVALETWIEAAFGVGHAAALPVPGSTQEHVHGAGIAALLPKLRGRDRAS